MGIRKRLGLSPDYAKILDEFDANYKAMIERIGKVPEPKNKSEENKPKNKKKS